MVVDEAKVWAATSNGLDILTPPPERTADEWADQCRVLPAGSAEPGKWRSSRTPYMIPIMKACSNPKYSRIAAVMAAQSGKTQGLYNYLGYRFDDDPVPVLFIVPNKDLAESISKNHLTAMLESAPSLWNKLAKGKRNTVIEKFISGVRLGFAWTGSPTQLSSHPAGIVLMDELDRMDRDVGHEGDPVGLATARTATYPGSKVILTSTPTIEGSSPIWTHFEAGTQHRWMWPCPDCGEYFAPKFELLMWPKGCTPQQAKKEATVRCPHCSSSIKNHHKRLMNANGRAAGKGQTVTPDGEIIGDEIDTDVFSMHVSGLCSPWVSFGDRAKDWLEAVRSGEPTLIQTSLNTSFGELYKLKGEAPDWQKVAALRSGYKVGDAPSGILRIVCAVDVHAKRFNFVVRGFGFNMESWLLEFGEIWGETKHNEVWGRLDDLLNKKWGGRSISLMLIDSGFKPGTARPINQIYEFCHRNPRRANPAKGHDVQDKPIKSTKIDIDKKGGVAKRSVLLWHLDSDVHKSWVHGRVNWPAGEPGAWHLPEEADEDYCKQVVSEQRAVKPSGNITWIKTKTDNHYLDCEYMAVAAAKILQVHMMVKKKTGNAVPTQPKKSKWMSR